MTEVIIAIKAHTRPNEYVVLGREDESVRGFFTRILSGMDGSQLSAHYGLTLGEAYSQYDSQISAEVTR
jgi:hypothetical protein